ncbi:hypothetical protein J6590_029926 [Homalodisca vitripennis]|nr:hypothetical protein J6590_029926 [Homalodisca vitripennis]
MRRCYGGGVAGCPMSSSKPQNDKYSRPIIPIQSSNHLYPVHNRDFRTTINGRACKDRIAQRSTIQGSSHSPRFLIRLSCDNRCTRYKTALAALVNLVDVYSSETKREGG